MLKPSARNTAVNGPTLPAEPGHTDVVSTRSNPTIQRSTSITFNAKKAWDIQVRKNSSKLQGNQTADCTPNIGPGPMFRPIFSPKSLPVLVFKEQNGLVGPTPSFAARKPQERTTNRASRPQGFNMNICLFPLRIFRKIQLLHKRYPSKSTFHKAFGGLLMHNPSTVQSASCFAKQDAITPTDFPSRSAANWTKRPRPDSWQARATAPTTPAGVAGQKGTRQNMNQKNNGTSKQAAAIWNVDFTTEPTPTQTVTVRRGGNKAHRSQGHLCAQVVPDRS